MKILERHEMSKGNDGMFIRSRFFFSFYFLPNILKHIRIFRWSVAKKFIKEESNDLKLTVHSFLVRILENAWLVNSDSFVHGFHPGSCLNLKTWNSSSEIFHPLWSGYTFGILQKHFRTETRLHFFTLLRLEKYAIEL